MNEHSPVNFAQPDNVTGRNSDPNSSMPGSHDAGRLSPALVESIAGLSAGSIATLVVHPLDIVKTRMQSELLVPVPVSVAVLVSLRRVGLVMLWRGMRGELWQENDKQGAGRSTQRERQEARTIADQSSISMNNHDN